MNAFEIRKSAKSQPIKPKKKKTNQKKTQRFHVKKNATMFYLHESNSITDEPLTFLLNGLINDAFRTTM